MCDTLDVTRGGYYRHVDRPPSASAVRRAELVGQIRRAHADSRGLYGSPRVAAELKASGITVGENTVARLMSEHRIRSKVAAKFRPRTTDSDHPNPVAPNLLGRDFSADRPDRKWATDITYVPTGEGTLYLAAVLDLCSRRIVGWAMADHMRATLCLDALDMAVLHRGRPTPGLVHHSDRGVQYACDAYRDRLDGHGMTASMSRAGDCYDNAAIESFWGTLKQELLYQQPQGRFANRAQATRMIFEYIEVYYNRRRRHSTIGFVSPDAFEASLN
jgi:transposase InsO family protein